MMNPNSTIAIVSLTIALAAQLILEATHRADSIGWWYTLGSAAVYAVPIFIAIKLLALAAKRAASSGGDGG